MTAVNAFATLLEAFFNIFFGRHTDTHTHTETHTHTHRDTHTHTHTHTHVQSPYRQRVWRRYSQSGRFWSRRVYG